MKKTNEIISEFNYNEAHVEILQRSLIKELGGLPTRQRRIYKGQAIYRCRKQCSIDRLFRSSSDLSYRKDIEKIHQFGRCNFSYSSKFYGSLASPEVDNGYVTAISETSSLFRDDREGCEIYSVGMWIAKENIDLMAVKPPSNRLSESTVQKELRSFFDANLLENGLNVHQKDFYELFRNEMIKKVATKENNQYFISSAISEILLQIETGILYPSVQTESKGLNVVFNPFNFDKNFYLHKILVGELFKFKKECLFRNLLICDVAEKDSFEYYYVDKKSYSNKTQVIEFFNKKNITTEHIMKTLNGQFDY